MEHVSYGKVWNCWYFIPTENDLDEYFVPLRF